MSNEGVGDDSAGVLSPGVVIIVLSILSAGIITFFLYSCRKQDDHVNTSKAYKDRLRRKMSIVPPSASIRRLVMNGSTGEEENQAVPSAPIQRISKNTNRKGSVFSTGSGGEDMLGRSLAERSRERWLDVPQIT